MSALRTTIHLRRFHKAHKRVAACCHQTKSLRTPGAITRTLVLAGRATVAAQVNVDANHTLPAHLLTRTGLTLLRVAVDITHRVVNVRILTARALSVSAVILSRIA